MKYYEYRYIKLCWYSASSKGVLQIQSKVTSQLVKPRQQDFILCFKKIETERTETVLRLCPGLQEAPGGERANHSIINLPSQTLQGLKDFETRNSTDLKEHPLPAPGSFRRRTSPVNWVNLCSHPAMEALQNVQLLSWELVTFISCLELKSLWPCSLVFYYKVSACGDLNWADSCLVLRLIKNVFILGLWIFFPAPRSQKGTNNTF